MIPSEGFHITKRKGQKAMSLHLGELFLHQGPGIHPNGDIRWFKTSPPCRRGNFFWFLSILKNFFFFRLEATIFKPPALKR